MVQWSPLGGSVEQNGHWWAERFLEVGEKRMGPDNICQEMEETAKNSQHCISDIFATEKAQRSGNTAKSLSILSILSICSGYKKMIVITRWLY